MSQGNSTADDDNESHTESSEGSDDSEEEVVHDLAAIKAKTQQRGPRASVSAEAFGTWNKKEEFKAPFYPKSDAVKSQLKQRLE
jgi:cAMP-dependent protein kinase regulator